MAETEDKVAKVETPKSAAAKLVKRTEQVKLALHFDKTYEFTDIGEDGVTLSSSVPVIPHSWVSEDFIKDITPLQRALLKTYDLALGTKKFTLDLPLGVTVLLGKAGKGKTRLSFDHLFLTTQANKDAAPFYFQLFEPGDEDKVLKYASDENCEIPDFEVSFASRLAEVMTQRDRELIIVDSLRYLFYSSSGGATGKGGVNMSLFMDITHLDRVARRLEKRVLLVVNPMSDDDVAFNYYTEAAIGAAAGVIVMESPTTGRISHRYASSREFVNFAIPRQAATDSFVARPRQEEVAPSVGASSGTNPSVRSALFGRNK